ncbi:hypothetical protein SGCOL_005522 [Colletotrichum sp. CLE4]
MASLSALAEDIMHGICEYLDLHEILQLTLTQKRFATSFERSLLLHRDLALQGYGAMMSAIINKNVGKVEELLKLGYDANFAQETQALACPADFPFPVNNLTLQAPSNVTVRRETSAFLAIERLYRPACDSHKIFISYSVLAHAVLEDQIDIVKLLHKRGANLENPLLQVFTFRGTPVDVDHQISLLHLASSGAMIETLLELAPNIPIDKDRCLQTEPLLLWHVDRGTDIKGLRRLLEAGAHVDGARPATQRLRFCQCREDGTLHLFLDHQSPLEAAIWNLDRDAVELSLERGASMVYPPNDEGEVTCLHEVIKLFLMDHNPDDLEVSQEIFRLLLDRGFDVNREYTESTGWTEEGTRCHVPTADKVNLLMEGLINPVSAEMFQFLLDAGADPYNASPGIPADESRPILLGLSASVMSLPTRIAETERSSSQITKLKALLAKRADSTGFDRYLLFVAALDIVAPAKPWQAFKVLHDVFGPFTEAMDRSLLADYMHNVIKTPGVLHAAVQIIELLISCGASINGANANGETALHVAYTLTKTSPLPIAEINDVLAWDLDEEQGFTVGWAIGTNTIGQQTINEFLSGLLSGPAEVEKRAKNATAIFDILIKAGADQSILNDKGETPAMVMAQQGWLQLPPSPGSDSGRVLMAEAKPDSAQDENILSSAFAIYKRLQELAAAGSLAT